MTDGRSTRTTRRTFLKRTAGVAGSVLVARALRDATVAFGAPAILSRSKLVVWKHDHPPANEYYRTMIDAYKRVAPNVEIEMATFPTGPYYARIPTALAGGEAIDIFDMADNYIPSLFRRGVLDRVNYAALGYKNAADMEADYIPGTLGFLKYDGEIYGTVVEYNVFSLGLNTAIFRQAGLDPHKDAPKTWDDVIRLGKTLVRVEGDRMVRAGFDSPFRVATGMNLSLSLALVRQYGGDVLTPDLRESLLTSEPALRGFQHWVDIYHTNRLVSPSFGVKTAVAPMEDFAQGNVAMNAFAPWGFDTLKGKAAENQVKIVRWPQGLVRQRTQAWLWGLLVNARSRNKEEAWKFVNWVFSGANLEQWLPNTGYTIPRKGWTAKPVARKFPYLNVFLEDMAISDARQKTDKWPQIQRVINRVNDQIVLDRMPVRQALTAAHDEVNRILQSP
jgi:multiple sugar transport system substrate-binding protein